MWHGFLPAMVALAATVVLFAAPASGLSPTASLDFAAWLERPGIVKSGPEAPPGPWANFVTLQLAATALRHENTFVSVDTNVVAHAVDADTGAPRWSTDLAPIVSRDVVICSSVRLSLDPTTFRATFGVVVVSSDGAFVILDSKTGRRLSNTTLPGVPAVQSSGTSIVPFKPLVASTPGLPDTAIALIRSRDATAVFFVTVAANGTVTGVSSANCGGANPPLRDALHRGAGKVVLHCPSSLIEHDVFTNTTRAVVHTNVAAVTTIEHSVTAVDGAPTPLTPSPAPQDVFFAGYSALQDSIVVGTVNFTAGVLSTCTLVDSGSRSILAIRALASDSGELRALVLQTAAGLVSVQSGSACPGRPTWTATYQRLATEASRLQQRDWSGDLSSIALVTQVPVPQLPGRPPLLLLAVRISTVFLVIDVDANAVVWTEASDQKGVCTAAGPTPLSPLLVSVNPQLDRVSLGCGLITFTVRLDTPVYDAASVRASFSTSAVPPFVTESGGSTRLPLAPPALFRNVTVSSSTSSITTTLRGGMAFRVFGGLGQAVLNGVVFAMNTLTSAGPPPTVSAAVTAVGTQGQLLWSRVGFPVPPSPASKTAIRVFGPYLLAATTGWQLYVLNATTGSTVRELSVSFECTAGSSNHGRSLFFDQFVSLDPAFAANDASGTAADPSESTAVVFSFGGCEYSLSRDLTLTRTHLALTASSSRTALNATHILTTTGGALRLTDLTSARDPRIVWEAPVPALGGILTKYKLGGNVLALISANAVAALLVADGTTLWVDTYPFNVNVLALFVLDSLAFFGDSLIVTSVRGVVAYYTAPRPVNPHLPQNGQSGDVFYGSAPQQIKWRGPIRPAVAIATTSGGISQYGRYVSVFGNNVTALDAATGVVVWHAAHSTPGPGALNQPDLHHTLNVTENIITVTFVSCILMLEESTGALLLAAPTDGSAALVFRGDFMTFLPPNPQLGAVLAVVSWPVFSAGARVLPLPPVPPAAPPTAHVSISVGFERPTYAPAVGPLPIPPLPVNTDVTSPPSHLWSMQYYGQPNTGVIPSINGFVSFVNNDDELKAVSMADGKTQLWSSPLPNCQMALWPVVIVSDEVGIVAVTCDTYVSAVNATNGAPLWTVPTSPSTSSPIIPPTSPAFGGTDRMRRGVVFSTVVVSDELSAVNGLDATTGASLWVARPKCALSAQTPARRVTGPAQLPATSFMAPDTVLGCQDGDRAVVISPSTGATFMMGSVFAANPQRRTIVSFNTTANTATTVDLATALPMATGPLDPPLHYSTSNPPTGQTLVVFDRRRNKDILIAADVKIQQAVHAYEFVPGPTAAPTASDDDSDDGTTKGTFRALWSVTAAHVCAVAGIFECENTLRFGGFAQPDVEEALNSVFGIAIPESETPTFNVLFRLDLADGHIRITAPLNFGNVNGNIAPLLLSDATEPGKPPRYFLQAQHFTALVDAATLTPDYVNLKHAFNDGLGTVVDTGSGLAFVGISSISHSQAIVVWPVYSAVRSFVAPGETVITTVDTDVIARRVVVVGDTMETFLVRRRALGPHAGELKWAANIPALNLVNDNILVTAVSDSAVVVFAEGGVFFYDFETGAVNTTVRTDVLQDRCLMDSTRFAWDVFTLDPEGPTTTETYLPVDFARPASQRALIIATFGPCMFMFNAKRELAVYRIPLYNPDAFAGSFALYAPTDAAPAVAALFFDIVEKWTLPVGFLTPGPRPAVVDYREHVGATLEWSTFLRDPRPTTSSEATIASDTLFVRDSTLTAVDMRSGALLWRYGETLAPAPVRVFHGRLFAVRFRPTGTAELVVLDAFALDPPSRVLKSIEVEPATISVEMVFVQAQDRVVVCQAADRLLGIDAVTLDVRWNVTSPGLKSHVRSLGHRPRTAPLYGAFTASVRNGAGSHGTPVRVIDSTTGATLLEVPGTAAPLNLVGPFCSPNPDGACGVLLTSTPSTGTLLPETAVSAIPRSVSVAALLPPAPPAPTSPTVPPGYRLPDPAPRNAPPQALPTPLGAPPKLLTAENDTATLWFVSRGVLVGHTQNGVVGMNASTGATMWSTPFNASLTLLCLSIPSVPPETGFLVVAFTCRPDGGLTIVTYDVDTGAVLGSLSAANYARITPGLAATLGNTACLTAQNFQADQTGILCLDVHTSQSTFYGCAGTLSVAGLAPNTARTALVMACGAAYSAGIAVDRPGPRAVLWQMGPTTLEDTGGMVQLDSHSATLSAVALVNGVTAGKINVTLLDTNTGHGHKYTAVVASDLLQVTALSTKYVALQLSQREMVIDVDAGSVVVSRTFQGQRCCAVMKLQPDGATVIATSDKRGTIEALDLATGKIAWSKSNALAVDSGADFVITKAPVPGGAGIAISNLKLDFFDAATGAALWAAPHGSVIAPTPLCLWTASGCYGYDVQPFIETVAGITSVTATAKAAIVADGHNIYTIGTPDPTAPLGAVDVHHVTPSVRGYRGGGTLFGGPSNGRFLAAVVDRRCWIFDVEANMTAVFAVDFPLSGGVSPSPVQLAHLPFAIGSGSAKGGALFVPGASSGVLAIIASTAGPKPTFTTKLWQTDRAITAPLVMYERSARPPPSARPERTCAVIAVLGGAAAAIDCVRLVPWWITVDAPSDGSAIPAAVSGDYVVYYDGGSVTHASAVTGQIVWRSAPVPGIANEPVFIWNRTVYFVCKPRGILSVVGFNLNFDPSAPEMALPPSFESPAAGTTQFIFAPGRVIQVSSGRTVAKSLVDAAVLWSTLALVRYSATKTATVIDGTLLIASSRSHLLAINVETGASSVVCPVSGQGPNGVAAVLGSPYVAVRTAAQTVQLVSVTAAPPLPPATAPLTGLPPAHFPPASPSTSPAPTVAPGSVLPSLGCVSRVVGAAEAFVSCVDVVAEAAYPAARFEATGAVVFQDCGGITAALRECSVDYLARMGVTCPAGASNIIELFGRLNATDLFGQCPRGGGGGGQCHTAAAAATLCKHMDGRITVPGVTTLRPGEHLAAGFAFPSPPNFALPPPPPSPAPSPQPSPAPATAVPTSAPDYSGLTTTFTLKYAATVAPASAAALATALQTYLHIDHITVHIMEIAGTVAEGQRVRFNVTSPNAQLVAGELGARPESSNAQALGGVQFATYFAPATTAPTNAPDYSGLTTTFTLKYAATVAPASAAALATALQTYLHIDHITVHIMEIAGTVAEGQRVRFNVTSPNAQLVAGELGARPESSNAQALGGVQFATYFAPATAAPTSAAPSPAPTAAPDYHGLTTTFTLKYAAHAVPESADLVASKLEAYLGLHTVTLQVVALSGTVAEGQRSVFRITSPNAQLVAGELGARPESSNARALGGVEFATYFAPGTVAPTPRPTEGPTSAPNDSPTSGAHAKDMAIAAAVTAVLTAVLVGGVVFIVMRRRARNGATLSQRELKTMNEDALLDAEANYAQSV